MKTIKKVAHLEIEVEVDDNFIEEDLNADIEATAFIINEDIKNNWNVNKVTVKFH